MSPKSVSLVPAGALGLLPRPDELLRAYPAAFQLVHRGQQGLEEGRTLGGAAIDLQLLGGLLHRPIHQQQPSAPVQLLLAQSARGLEHPVGQAAEGQHLCPQGDPRAASLT